MIQRYTIYGDYDDDDDDPVITTIRILDDCGEWVKYTGHLAELEAVKNRVCEWKVEETDEFHTNYETGCDNIFTMTEGTSEDNEFYFCAYCGGKIELKSEVE